MQSRPSFALVVAFLIALQPSRATAQEDPTRRAAVEKLREGAARAFEQGRFEEALAIYRDAWEKSGAARDLYNIGICHDRLGHPAEAVEALEHALAEARGMPEAQRKNAEKKIAANRAKVGAIIVAEAPPGARVEIDGKRREKVPAQGVAVMPGSHDVKVSAEGYTALERQVHVGGGEVATVVARLGALPAPASAAPSARPEPGSTVSSEAAKSAPAPVAAPPPRSSPPSQELATPPAKRDEAPPPRRRRVATWAIGALGVVAIGAAIGTGVVALQKRDDLDAMCGAAHDNCPSGFEATRDTGRALEISTYALAAVGGAAVVTAVALFFVEGRGTTKGKVTLAPTVLPGGGGVAMGGAF